MKIESFNLKGIIKECMGCFLVYPFYGSLFKKKRKEKKVLLDEGFKILFEILHQVAPYTTTYSVMWFWHKIS